MSQVSDLPIERKQVGFTLIELSMVLVVIGLLIGGVMAGNELIKQANLRYTVTRLKLFESSIKQFETRYAAMPGDMENATSMFVSSLVKNGNGDGKISVFTRWVPTAVRPQEGPQALVHLSQAGIFPGLYTGVGVQEIGVNIASAGEDRMLGLMSNTHFSRDQNSIVIGGPRHNLPYCFWCMGVVTVREAKAIDSKIDDGVANAGMLFGVDGDLVPANACSAPGTTATGNDYNAVSTNAKVCRLFYYLQRDYN